MVLGGFVHPGGGARTAAERHSRTGQRVGITATWQAPASTGGSPITGYKVQWRAESEGYDSGRQAAVTDLTDLSYEITGLSNGTKYFIRVVAVNAVGDGAPAAGACSHPCHQSGSSRECRRRAGRPVRDGNLGGCRRRRLGHHAVQGAVARGRRQVQGFGFSGHGWWEPLRAGGSRVSPMAPNTGCGCRRPTAWVTGRGRRRRPRWRRPSRARPAALSPGGATVR